MNMQPFDDRLRSQSPASYSPPDREVGDRSLTSFLTYLVFPIFSLTVLAVATAIVAFSGVDLSSYGLLAPIELWIVAALNPYFAGDVDNTPIGGALIFFALSFANIYGATYAIIGTYFLRFKVSSALVYLCVVTLLILLIYSFLYKIGGMMQDGHITYDYSVSIYASVTTMTTLGFGDFSPAAGVRYHAAVQSVVGYICLGTLVGLAAGGLISRSNQLVRNYLIQIKG